MSHKQAKKVRLRVRLLLREGFNERDPRLTMWTGASKRNVRRVIERMETK